MKIKSIYNIVLWFSWSPLLYFTFFSLVKLPFHFMVFYPELTFLIAMLTYIAYVGVVFLCFHSVRYLYFTALHYNSEVSVIKVSLSLMVILAYVLWFNFYFSVYYSMVDFVFIVLNPIVFMIISMVMTIKNKCYE